MNLRCLTTQNLLSKPNYAFGKNGQQPAAEASMPGSDKNDRDTGSRLPEKVHPEAVASGRYSIVLCWVSHKNINNSGTNSLFCANIVRVFDDVLLDFSSNKWGKLKGDFFVGKCGIMPLLGY